MRIVYDIETASLDLDSPVWCLFLSIDGNKPVGYSEYSFSDLSPISEAFETMYKADEIWGWNNLSFDSVVLNNRYGVTFENEHDGLILAKLILSKDELLEEDYKDQSMPNALKGSYSLAAFGYRLRDYKLHNESFEQLSEEMLTYCSQDVALTTKLIERLKYYRYQPPEKVLALEEETARIIASQSVYGWNIDIPATHKLKTELEKKMVKLKLQLREVFQPKFLPDGKPKTPKRPVYIDNSFKVVGDE